MDIVELGGIRLHILRVHPGLPHEADRVTRELQKLQPAVVLADLTTADALAVRAALAEKKEFEPSFVDSLLADVSRARYAGESRNAATLEHPLAAAARFARDRRSEFIPIRPIAKRPGFFARRRMRKLAQHAEAASHDAYPAAFVKALAGNWDPGTEVDAAHQRITRALAEGRAPIIAIVQAHRAEAYLQAMRATRRIPA